MRIVSPGRLGLLVVAACMFLTLDAFAAGFSYKIQNQKSQTGGDHAMLILEATSIIKRATVRVTSKTAKSRTVNIGRMNPSATKRIVLKAPAGQHDFQVEIKAVGVEDEAVKIPFTFSTVRVKPIKVSIDRDKVDTGKGTMAFRSNVPMDKVEMELFDENFKKVMDHEESFSGKSGDLTFSWPAQEKVGAIRLKFHDVAGFWTAYVLEPWFVEIDHEEIIFDFGKATWQPPEEPKLKKSLGEIKRAMKRFPKHRKDMRLYIAGYTDTVGSKAENRKLSSARARAIAQWFRKNGVKLDVYYQGFGEDALAVKTADNTAEARNRRATYMLANTAPPSTRAMPGRAWRKVK